MRGVYDCSMSVVCAHTLVNVCMWRGVRPCMCGRVHVFVVVSVYAFVRMFCV